MNSVVDDGAGGRFGVGLADAVTAPERMFDLLGELGRGAVDEGEVHVDIAWGSLVQDGTAVVAGRGDQFSLGALTAARSRNLSPRRASGRDGSDGFVTGRGGAVAGGRLGVESAWLRVPVLGEGVEPGVGRHGRMRRRTSCRDRLVMHP